MLYHRFDALTNTKGDSLPGYQVRVVNSTTKAIAPIYSDAGGTPIATVSVIANTALTDKDGNYSFFVEAGTYDEQYLTPAGAFIKAVLNIPMSDGVVLQSVIDNAANSAANAVRAQVAADASSAGLSASSAATSEANAQAIADSLGTVTTVTTGPDQAAPLTGTGVFNTLYIASEIQPAGKLKSIIAKVGASAVGNHTARLVLRSGTTNDFTSTRTIPLNGLVEGYNRIDVSSLNITDQEGRQLAMDAAGYRSRSGGMWWYYEGTVPGGSFAAVMQNGFDIILSTEVEQVAPAGASIVSLTQTAYDALNPPVATTLYSVTSANRRRLYLGSLLLSSEFIPSLAAVGDSTIAAYLGRDAIASFIANASGTTLAVPGHTIGDQTTTWNGQSSAAKLTYDVVVIQVGLNDCYGLPVASAASAAADKITAYQNLVNVIRGSTKAGCKIVVSKMLPARQRYIDLYGATNGAGAQEMWRLLNEAIAGNGSTPITGVDGRIVSHVPLLDDGNGNLAAAYDTGDHIHENTAGGRIIAKAWIAVLMAIGSLA